MSPRVHAIAFAVPVLFAGVVLAASAINGRSARGPTVLTEREAVLSPRTADRSIAEVWLGWTEPAGQLGAWLTREDLAALGFDAELEATDPRAESYYRRQLTRRAFVAFELNGPAWQAVLAQREADAEGRPGGLERGGAGGSRLVPVAVDRDASVLARRYPDPQTHLIAAATVRIVRFQPANGTPYVGGMLLNIDPQRIQIAAALAAALPRREPGETARTPYTVTLMYGRRWEPWVVAAGP